MKGTSGLCCSFCHKPQKSVGKLIASPSDEPRAYICDECVTVCAMVLEDDRNETLPAPTAEEERSELLGRPGAGRLLSAIEAWIRAEALHGSAQGEFNEMRALAEEFCGRER